MTRAGKVISVIGVLVIVALLFAVLSIIMEGEDERLGTAAPDEQPTSKAALSRAEQGEGSAGAGPAGERRASAKSRRLPNVEAREKLRQAIEAARTRRQSAEQMRDVAGKASSPTTANDEPPRGKLDREYIRDVVRESVDLIKECYEMELEENPRLEGKIIAHFTIAGEEEVGGLVEEAEIEMGEGFGGNANLAECMRETVLSLEFPPPEGGGVVEVSYPFLFKNSDEGPDAAPPSTE